MKRLNPKTGLPFKQGDIREDGYIFMSYQVKSKPLQKNGFFQEQWLSPEKAKLRISDISLRSKEHSRKTRLTPLGRAKELIASAKKRGNISVTEDWVIEKIKIGFCEISGLPFDLSKPNKFFKNPYSPSLDRINSKNKNYSLENTRVVLTCINEALNQYGLEHFLKVANAVIDKQKEK